MTSDSAHFKPDRIARWRAMALGLLLSLTIALLAALVAVPEVAIAAAPSQLAAREVRVHLGNTANALVFEPDHLSFEAGQRYKLILDNPSDQKHYFTAKDFADNLWTQKVEAGNVEFKGVVHELELKPGAVAEWVFVPQKPGTYELHCSIAGHAEAGMRGILIIDS